MNKAPVLYIVVPCYNEEAVLPETAKRLGKKLFTLISAGKAAEESRILFVDDGSKDRTWKLIEACHKTNPHFAGISLSRNRGHQNALLAGLMTAKGRCDVTISMDADLQDDIGAVDEMLEKYAEGCEIVYGVRSARNTDTFFKKFTAHAFYRLMHGLGVQTVSDHADYRLMGKKALEALSQFREVNLFLRGIVPQLGYKTDIVYYERAERFAGESKYPLKKMISFAVDGITSFSVRPIDWIVRIGMLISFISFLFLVISWIRYGKGTVEAPYGVMISSIYLVGGILLTAVGIVGEYAGKTYMETKRRPRYVIEKTLL